VAVVLVSGNTRGRAPRTQCSVLADAMEFGTSREQLHGHCSVTVLALRNFCVQAKNNNHIPAVMC
jgi:hypothetical protein